MAKRLIPVLDEEIVLLAEDRGEAVAFILSLPDFNEALGRLRGRLLSPRLPLVLPYLLGLKHPRFVRVMAMGIKREYRQRGIDAALIGRCLRAMLRPGVRAVRDLLDPRGQPADAPHRRDVRRQPLQDLRALRRPGLMALPQS